MKLASLLSHSSFRSVRLSDRAEVRDILAYLRLALRPSDFAAFERAVCAPKRGIGQVTLQRLQAAWEESNRREEVSVLRFLSLLCAGGQTAVNVLQEKGERQMAGLQRKLKPFLRVVEDVRRSAEAKHSAVNVLVELITESGLKDHILVRRRVSFLA